jgi:RNA polymerase sigma-70 factor (ECF subfamily)
MSAAAQLERYRPALTGHCYRMLGSVVDAEDAVQEAMLRALKSLPRLSEPAALKTWLYRIATNVCLDTLSDGKRRRFHPLELHDEPAEVTEDMSLPQRPREDWVEPVPDALALPAPEDSDPEELAILRESIRLAFVVALQHLPPRQRAVLLLTQVLNWSAAETAASLGMSVAAVNSALQRARATLKGRGLGVAPQALSEEQERFLARYVEAFERYDVATLARVLHEDVTMSMPPYAVWLKGPDSVAKWFLGHGIGCRGSRLVRVEACGGTPTFAQYRDGGATPWALILLDLEGTCIRHMTSFLDVQTLFPRFGLPLELAS